MCVCVNLVGCLAWAVALYKAGQKPFSVIQSKKELKCEQLEKNLKIQFARKLKYMREMDPEDRFWALCSIDHAMTYED